MKINSTMNTFQPSYKGLGMRQVKVVAQKTKNSVKNLEKKGGFMSTPIKYYAVGMLLPVPFASAVGLVIGLGVATYKKFFSKNKPA